MSMPVLSPLTGSDRVDHLRDYSFAELQRRWRRKFSIDLRAELPSQGRLSHWRCLDTDLEFFTPGNLAGSPELYRQLSGFPWYHDAQRWEFDAALAWLEDAHSVLEVGCGSGAFLDRIAKRSKGDAIGIELNARSAVAARARGHRVYQQPIESDTIRSLAPFDAVCSFQVLEHVADPLDFLKAMLAVLRPGGRLVIGVPNADSFIRHWSVNLLDLPPHHVTRWHAETFRRLSPILGIDILNVAVETLSTGHATDYIEAQIQRVLPIALLPRAVAWTLGPSFARAASLRRRIAGHSLLAVFQKPV